jgi:hypothetical protein
MFIKITGSGTNRYVDENKIELIKKLCHDFDGKPELNPDGRSIKKYTSDEVDRLVNKDKVTVTVEDLFGLDAFKEEVTNNAKTDNDVE